MFRSGATIIASKHSRCLDGEMVDSRNSKSRAKEREGLKS